MLTWGFHLHEQRRDPHYLFLISTKRTSQHINHLRREELHLRRRIEKAVKIKGMEEVSTEPLILVAKADLKTCSTDCQPELAGAGSDFPAAGTVAMADAGVAEIGDDLLCPMCMQIINDAFLAACGHNFCYKGIITHLRHKSDCPYCGHYLINNQLSSNFLLDK